MAIPFQIKEDQDKKRETVPLKVAVTPEPMSETENEVTEGESFVGRLLQELMEVYLRSSSGGRSSLGVERRRRKRSQNESPQSSQTTQFTPLPDVIRSHVQTVSTNPLPTPVSYPGVNYHHKANQDSNPKLTNLSFSTRDDFTSHLALDIKISIDFSFGRIGRNLRRIGDTFDSSRNRRLHSAGNHKKIRISLRLVISATLADVTLISLLSLVLWRSRLF